MYTRRQNYEENYTDQNTYYAYSYYCFLPNIVLWVYLLILSYYEHSGETGIYFPQIQNEVIQKRIFAMDGHEHMISI